MKIDKVYINKEGAPMVSRNGWPEVPDSLPNPIKDRESIAIYREASAKAKSEAVPLEGFLAFKYAPGIHLRADAFIEVDINVEFLLQFRINNGMWVDPPPTGFTMPRYSETRTIARVVPDRKNGDIWYEGSELKAKVRDEEHHLSARVVPERKNYLNIHGKVPLRVVPGKAEECGEPTIKVRGQGFHIDKMKADNGAHSYTEAADVVADWKARAIAHLSEGNQRCECELFVEKYFGLPERVNENYIVPGADYGQMVNMLAMFRDEQLAAAQARIKQLEHDDGEGFEKYQELLVENRNLSERLKNLEYFIKSDVVHALLRFGYKNPSSSGCDNFEGSENIDLYNISVDLRAKTEG